MTLANRLLDPTDCFLVAFDIVSSSQNLANPSGLERDRQTLFNAINQSSLVRGISHAMVGQFLGDEYRLAIPAIHDGASISADDAVKFIDEVFHTLKDPALGYAPVIRAALTKGPVRSRELQQFCYLSSGTSLPRLARLLKAIDGKDNLLITNLSLPDFEQIDDPIQGTFYTKYYRTRDVPKPFSGSTSHDLPNYVVVAITNEPRDVNETLLEFARVCLEGHSPLRISVSPSSIVFAFLEARFDRSKHFLRRIQEQSRVYKDGLQIAVAIGYGPGRTIDEKEWLSKTFESGTAIEACRLLAKLPMGALAIPDDSEQLEFFSSVSSSLVEKLTLPGKRKESFQCRIDSAYFPKNDPIKTEIPNIDTTARPDLSGSTIHVAKIDLRQESSENQKARNMLLNDQDWLTIADASSRIPQLDEIQRDLFIRHLAGDELPNQDLARLIHFQGNQEFFAGVTNVVRPTKDLILQKRVLEAMLPLVLNNGDKQAVKQLMTHRFGGNEKQELNSAQQSPKVMPSGKTDFRQQLEEFYINSQWVELLNLVDEMVRESGSDRSKSFANTVVMFRADYQSIQNQLMSGLVSVEEGSRRLASVWVRVQMLIQELGI